MPRRTKSKPKKAPKKALKKAPKKTSKKTVKKPAKKTSTGSKNRNKSIGRKTKTSVAKKSTSKRPANASNTLQQIKQRIGSTLDSVSNFFDGVGKRVDKTVKIVANKRNKKMAMYLFLALSIYLAYLEYEKLTRPFYGISSTIPVVGTYIVQVRIFTQIFSLVQTIGGPVALGLTLTFFGHTLFYLAIFSLATCRALLFWTPVFSSLQWVALNALNNGSNAWAMSIVLNPLLPAVLPIGMAMMQGVSETAAIMDFIPTAIASVFGFGLAFADQIFNCMITNVFYNQAVWWIEWNSFNGLITFWPMLFCHDSRASMSSEHHKYLRDACIDDLGSSAAKFCSDVTGPSNTYRIAADAQTCLSIGHVFFVALIFAALYHGMHKLQKQAIIQLTTFAGMWLMNDFVQDYNYLGLFSFINYGGALFFQTHVSSRITRTLGLDLSPPDQIPLSLAEAWVSLYAGIRTVVLSMHKGLHIVALAWVARLAMRGTLDFSPFPCSL